ncbi:hypothetical protein BDZ94DRAFT_320548 [Collybia nuda]|uniref:Heterokaryon incompatibility domain-containing protein n=1 Tax=Collybia nuda TaxID=64659 RepID=A0A9P6C943_9AGAR|nr:hypothetical protein BDZ94DRAFT_320548 [Collybia nuda]
MEPQPPPLQAPNPRRSQNTPICIFTSKLDQMRNSHFDLSLHTEPCRYRLLECAAFTSNQELKLFEFSDISNVPYTAISYTWRGNETSNDNPSDPTYWKDVHGTFQVKGALDGDPISLDVLEHVCILALQNQSQYIWLDRLCILQTSKEDKSWQIRRMHSIYKNCVTCCILPGGIRRLVALEEETGWIHRGWTLQEAIVPKHSLVLFRWNHELTGKTISVATAGGSFGPSDVIGGQFTVDGKDIPISVGLFGTRTNRLPTSALMDALTAFGESTSASSRGNSKSGHMKAWTMQKTRAVWKPLKNFKKNIGTAVKQRISFRTSSTFTAEDSDNDGHHSSDLAQEDYSLDQQFDLSEYLPRRNKDISVSFGEEDDTLTPKYQSVWRSAFLRTSSRPVDMVFSIMNIFDVSLDPSDFDKDDRIKATVALAREILKRGGKASWIGAAYGLDPSPELSSFPRFPKTSVNGMAYLDNGQDGMERSAVDAMSETMRGGAYLRESLSGSMDDAGYLTISAPAIGLSFVESRNPAEVTSHNPWVLETQLIASASQTQLSRVTRHLRIIAHDGSVWQLNKFGEVSTNTHATYLVFIGQETWSTIPAYAAGTFMDPAPIRAWIVQEHSPGRFHRVSFAKLWLTFSLMSFPQVTLSIGGPGTF